MHVACRLEQAGARGASPAHRLRVRGACACESVTVSVGSVGARGCSPFQVRLFPDSWRQVGSVTYGLRILARAPRATSEPRASRERRERARRRLFFSARRSRSRGGAARAPELGAQLAAPSGRASSPRISLHLLAFVILRLSPLDGNQASSHACHV